MIDAGRYCLIIKLDRRVRLRLGRLGRVEFQPGFYVYTGSALRGLRARLARHLKRHKRKHWHIDYLLTNRHARVASVILVTEKMSECELNQLVLSQAKGSVPGFGSSDCRSGCGSHLAYLGAKPPALTSLQSCTTYEVRAGAPDRCVD